MHLPASFVGVGSRRSRRLSLAGPLRSPSPARPLRPDLPPALGTLSPFPSLSPFACAPDRARCRPSASSASSSRTTRSSSPSRRRRPRLALVRRPTSPRSTPSRRRRSPARRPSAGPVRARGAACASALEEPLKAVSPRRARAAAGRGRARSTRSRSCRTVRRPRETRTKTRRRTVAEQGGGVEREGPCASSASRTRTRSTRRCASSSLPLPPSRHGLNRLTLSVARAQCWSTPRRTLITLLLALLCTWVGACSSMNAPLADKVAADLGVDGKTTAQLDTVLFLVGFGVAAPLWAPLSELAGRCVSPPRLPLSQPEHLPNAVLFSQHAHLPHLARPPRPLRARRRPRAHLCRARNPALPRRVRRNDAAVERWGGCRRPVGRGREDGRVRRVWRRRLVRPAPPSSSSQLVSARADSCLSVRSLGPCLGASMPFSSVERGSRADEWAAQDPSAAAGSRRAGGAIVGPTACRRSGASLSVLSLRRESKI